MKRKYDYFINPTDIYYLKFKPKNIIIYDDDIFKDLNFEFQIEKNKNDEF